jgi:molecular chaperone IbpA
MEMSKIDFSPLYGAMIGVDRMADLVDAAPHGIGDSGYPPFDFEQAGEDRYRITVAVAGFSPEDLEIVARPNLLQVAGRTPRRGETGRTFLHRGLALRPFERRFDLADHVVVTGATYAEGLLSIDLERQLPEALKPRRIDIQAAQARLDGPAKARKAA